MKTEEDYTLSTSLLTGKESKIGALCRVSQYTSSSELTLNRSVSL